jgi:hypothetical protein
MAESRSSFDVYENVKRIAAGIAGEKRERRGLWEK